jgi:hypothetical protein
MISRELIEEEMLNMNEMKYGAELMMNKLYRDARTMIDI